jgi:hypothetical protein
VDECKPLMSGNPSSPGALAAAAAYTAMLASPGCPAFSLFTSLGFGAALRVLKAACSKAGAYTRPLFDST